MAFRIDRGTLRPPKRLPDGRLRVDAVITRSGVFEYRQPDGTIRKEYRPPAEVFRADALESFSLAPVTDEHPPEMVTVDNIDKYSRGTAGENMRRDGDHVVATLMITNKDLIAKMDAGKKEISCGYNVDLDETPGTTPEGQRYDAVQRGILGNHIAVVNVGRAGPEVCARLDSAAEQGAEVQPSKGKIKMDPELEKALIEQGKAELRADTAEAKLADTQKQLSAMEAQLDAEKVRADEAEAKAEKIRTDSGEDFQTRVDARVDLLLFAKPLLGEEFRADASDLELKISCVEKIDGQEIKESKREDAAYIQARFDYAVERHAKESKDRKDGADSLASFRKVADENSRKDSDPVKAARQRMIERNRKMREDAKTQASA